MFYPLSSILDLQSSILGLPPSIFRPQSPASFTSACGRIVLISKIEIIGKKRMNRNNKLRKSPIVPRNIEKSQIVGLYIAQDEGRKSRCRLVTIITNRSSHIPMLTMSELTNKSGTFQRTFLDHRSCGITMLQVISDQYSGA